MLVLAGQSCQTDRVSLDEARRIASGVQGPRFEAPPNTINDILTLIGADRPADQIRLEQTTKEADAQPPAGATESTLARFYASRAEAAQRLGRADAAGSDYQRAIEASTRARTISNNEATGWRFGAGLFVINSGDLVKGLRMIEEANEILRPDLKSLQLNELGQAYGRVMAFESMIAIVNARLGDLASARAALKRARDVEAEFASLIAYGRSYGALTPDDVIGNEIAQGTLRAAIGRVAALSGSVDEGISDMRTAIQRLARYNSGITGISRDVVVNVRVEAYDELAAMLAAKGDVVEAEVMARQALVLSVENLGRYNAVTASALAKLGEILLLQGRYDQAEAIGKKALADLATTRASGHSRATIEARSILARALAARGQWPAALKEFREIEAALKQFAPRYAEFALASDSGFATVAYFGGAPEVAVAAAESERRWRIEVLGPNAYQSVEASGFVGAALWRAGRKDDAKQLLSATVPNLLTAGNDVKRPFLARARMEAIVGAFLAANGIDRTGVGGPGSVVEIAFRLAEDTRGSKLAESLNAAAARASATALPGLSDLIRQKDDVELKADAAHRMLSEALVVPGIARDDPRVIALRTDASRLGAAATALRNEVNRRFPDYGALAAPPAATLAAVAESLAPGEALISILDGTEHAYVWAVPKTGPARVAVVDLPAREFAATIAKLRQALAPPDVATLGDIPPFDLNLAHQLYVKLFQPVDSVVRDAKHLIVVATGAVPSLPIGVLPTEPVAALSDGEPLFSQYRRVSWLIRRSATSYVPSAATLIALRRLPTAAGVRPFVGFGDPIFGVETAAAEGETAMARGAPMRGAPLKLRASPPVSDRKVTLADLPRL
ncbi:MAG TPA: tetratricopeptide repeat protein, partial [Burkholderiales bacterium]|nr:tetratricopeptide repeat protein [Burkholderiales bacterium]